MNKKQLYENIIKNLQKELKIILNEEKEMSPSEKMDAWHNGDRDENIKACGADKLKKYKAICKAKGYDAEVDALQSEIDKRGLKESAIFENHDFGPEFNKVIEHVNNGEVDTKKDCDILFDALVPSSGPANTLAGELLRAANKIGYRAYNDGDAAGYGYGRETVNPAVRFMYENIEKDGNSLFDIVKKFYKFAQSRLTPSYLESYSYNGYKGKRINCKRINQNYLDLVDELLKETIIYVVENKLWNVPNNEDMWEYRDPKKDIEW